MPAKAGIQSELENKPRRHREHRETDEKRSPLPIRDLETAPTYRRLLDGAGFEVVTERSRRRFAIEFFRQIRARAAESKGAPPLGLHILMGPSARQKTANMIDNLERGVISPTEMIARSA